MAKQRIVNTKFYRDRYILDLESDARFLFLWAITNPATDLCGAYEAALPIIEVETGLKADRILEICDRFAADGKMFYKDGWVIIPNFLKHQDASSANIQKGIERSLNACPDWVKDVLRKGMDTPSKGMDTPSKGMDTPSIAFELPEPEPEPEPDGIYHTHARDFEFQEKPEISEPVSEPETEPHQPPAHSNLNPDDFTYPIRELVEAFPNMELTPAAIGFIEAEVKAEDKIPWQRTVRKYRMNFNPLKRAYLPEKTANLLGVFADEKRKYEQGRTNTKRTDADVFAESAEFYANYEH